MTKQFMLALVIMLGVSLTAQGKQSFQPTYKVENCDCFGVEEDIPTFLSDIASTDFSIEATAKSRRAAQKKADKMCVQAYRDFASEEPDAYTIKSNYQVSSTGCKIYRNNSKGDWKAL